MRRVPLTTAFATLGMILGFAASASADTTLGTVTPPTGSTTHACVLAQVTWSQTGVSAGGPSYDAPSAGGITSWSTDTVGDTAGSQVDLVVLRPKDSNRVIAVDTETLPTPLPTGNVATFELATPISVAAGDRIGISSLSNPFNTCAFGDSAFTAADTAGVYGATPTLSDPAAGQTLTSISSVPTARVNVAATEVTQNDVSVSTGSSPANPTVGNFALLTSTVANHGQLPATINFVDTVPAGLSVVDSVSRGGPCTAGGQTVSCTIQNLAAGSSAPVVVVVKPSAPGRYTNAVSVEAPGLPESNPSDNAARATLDVTHAGSTVANERLNGCLVPKLNGTPSAVAKRLLKQLGCKVKVKHRHGHGVARGSVLKTKPGAGSYKRGRKITLVVRK